MSRPESGSSVPFGISRPRPAVLAQCVLGFGVRHISDKRVMHDGTVRRQHLNGANPQVRVAVDRKNLVTINIAPRRTEVEGFALFDDDVGRAQF